ncbi:HD-GYP domain-containing protein [Cohnella endophytica]|uniref:HD-GYP domain-containing protein n=1 Tax=Cohnella endophytica TaxID=2419778 RepID=A0A494XUD3_9BACL|nr:HD-GYP domain-containing protein [Cohnella endophytica]RKP54178.1 HD-GYP domain-containing protein [Cohnella endophytica]
MRVHITDVRSGDQLSEDIFNSFGLNVLSKGTILNDREISRMYQHQIDFIEIQRRPGTAPAETEKEDKPNSNYNPLLRPLYHDAVAGAEQLFTRALEEGKIYEDDVKESFQPLVDNFRAERDVVSLLLMLNSQDDYTYQHSVQVGMLSYYIARWLGWNEEETVRAGKAGFLHDVGKCKIADAILNKPYKLTDDEYDEIKSHPQYGYEILKNSFDDPGIALAALQHHERIDGKGYPLGLTGDKIHPLAKIVAVADVYSAMISSRVYSDKKDLLQVLRELFDLSFTELDPEITHTFIRHMIPNFIGKRVELSSGESGTIVMSNPTDFFRPLVQVDEQFIDLSVKRDLEIKQVFM